MAVIELVKPEHPAPQPEVVDMLETLLARAKLGQIRSIMACYENADRTITTSMELHGGLFAMSHALSALWYRFQMRMHEEQSTDHGHGEQPNG